MKKLLTLLTVLFLLLAAMPLAALATSVGCPMNDECACVPCATCGNYTCACVNCCDCSAGPRCAGHAVGATAATVTKKVSITPKERHPSLSAESLAANRAQIAALTGDDTGYVLLKDRNNTYLSLMVEIVGAPLTAQELAVPAGAKSALDATGADRLAFVTGEYLHYINKGSVQEGEFVASQEHFVGQTNWLLSAVEGETGMFEAVVSKGEITSNDATKEDLATYAKLEQTCSKSVLDSWMALVVGEMNCKEELAQAQKAYADAVKANSSDAAILKQKVAELEAELAGYPARQQAAFGPGIARWWKDLAEGEIAEKNAIKDGTSSMSTTELQSLYAKRWSTLYTFQSQGFSDALKRALIAGYLSGK